METIKLSQHFEVPPDVAGYLEWGSGILRVNCSFQDWVDIQKLIEKHPDGPRSYAVRTIIGTLTHENFHFLQICTSGFLYIFACQYLKLMIKLIKQTAGYPLTDEKIKTFLENPSGPSNEIIYHVSKLDRAGRFGVTVRDIIESAAYLYEHKTHYVNIDIEGYENLILRDDPPTEYYFAFNKSK